MNCFLNISMNSPVKSNSFRSFREKILYSNFNVFIVIAHLLHFESMLIWQKLATLSMMLVFFQATQDALVSVPQPAMHLGGLAMRPVESECGNDVCSFLDCLKMAHVISMVIFSFV